MEELNAKVIYDIPIPENFTGIVSLSGSQSTMYLVDGTLHREDGPAYIQRNNQQIICAIWYKNGKFHREDGPAVDHFDGYKEYWLNDLLHRADGPAIEYVDSPLGLEGGGWYLNGVEYGSREAWFNDLTTEQKENALWNVELWK